MQYYTVLYTKRAGNKKRKNKSFADGTLAVKLDSCCTLYNEEGKSIAKSKVQGSREMPEGAELIIGNWEVEVDSKLSEASFRAGECFSKGPSTSASQQLTFPVAKLRATGFKLPIRTTTTAIPHQVKPQWLHDPNGKNALVLNPDQDGAVRVVVDPYICKHLRPHQREGVQFLYECVMGLRNAANLGAVLADEMGLGKTLQVISLLWTLLKQGPQGKPVAKRAIVVTPSSLTRNWAAEVRKWLGDERLRVLVLQAGVDAKQQVTDFKHGALFKVMVSSYETLRKHTAELTGCCDVLVCDEGHRLKAAGGSKTMDALLALNCPRRILLTGTPLQNNLDEFYALVSFVSPNVLGRLSSFKAIFAGPISRSQDRNATAEEAQLGKEHSKELNRRMESFVLRRTSSAIAKFLPPLSSYVVFCRPSALQVRVYNAILKLKLASSMLHGAGCLEAITMLQKLCNHPSLLQADQEHPACCSGLLSSEDMALMGKKDVVLSGKLVCLEALMKEIVDGVGDRIVVVCSSVTTLSIIQQQLCNVHGWKTVRIDGSTPSDQRQDIVTNFNLYHVGQVCLLSTRAGGAGLNLIGANRLVLFDSDWNPAVDLQAMARVWRDGQPKACVIYRLLTTGTIDEKIYQRQLMKGELAGIMTAHDTGGKGGFTREELRALFQLDTVSACSTADLLRGSQDYPDASASLEDRPLRSVLAAGCVSYVYLSPPATISRAADVVAAPMKDAAVGAEDQSLEMAPA